MAEPRATRHPDTRGGGETRPPALCQTRRPSRAGHRPHDDEEAAIRSALTFPGQGSQRPGMGSAWTSTPGWSLVERASDAVGRDLARLLLDAPAEELRRPREAQVSTFLASLLALEALREAGVLERLAPVAVAGHSLGEYTALVAAGALTPEAGLALVAERGEAMQAAADARPGTMAAVLGADAEVVAEACAEAREGGAEVWPANDNVAQHVVISGTEAGVEAGGAAAKARGARRVVPIPVGGAYHTPLMQPAEERLGHALSTAVFADAAIPVIANVDAAPHASASEWPALLRRQLTGQVRWRETLERLTGDGVTLLVEVGPGGVLTGLARRGAPGARAVSVSQPDDVGALAADEALADGAGR